jgi:thiol-disulfide isomerase/thioredoxin
MPPAPPSNAPLNSPLRLAMGSVMFGCLGVFLSVFVIGAVPALIGLALGIAQWRKSGGARPLARWGVGICACALLASVGFAFAWRSGAEHRRAALDSFLAQLPAWRGVAAPAATFRRLDDSAVKLADLRGKPVVITFWSTGVPPCIDEVPHLIRLRREVPEKQLAILAISLERPKQLQRFAEQKGINYTLCWLGRLDVSPPPFDNILAVPVTFFLDRHGIIQEVTTGCLDFNTLKAKALAPDWTGPTNAAPPTAVR